MFPILAVARNDRSQFTIGAPVRVRCGLSSLSSKTTIYQYQVNLEQRTIYVSPRDSRSRSTTQTYKILERGTRPLKTPVKIPDDQISLWSGTDVGGHDVDSFKFDQTGRLPNDLHARPSTPSMYVYQASKSSSELMWFLKGLSLRSAHRTC